MASVDPSPEAQATLEPAPQAAPVKRRPAGKKGASADAVRKEDTTTKEDTATSGRASTRAPKKTARMYVLIPFTHILAHL